MFLTLDRELLIFNTYYSKEIVSLKMILIGYLKPSA